MKYCLPVVIYTSACTIALEFIVDIREHIVCDVVACTRTRAAVGEVLSLYDLAELIVSGHKARRIWYRRDVKTNIFDGDRERASGVGAART